MIIIEKIIGLTILLKASPANFQFPLLELAIDAIYHRCRKKTMIPQIIIITNSIIVLKDNKNSRLKLFFKISNLFI